MILGGYCKHFGAKQLAGFVFRL